MSSFTPYSDMRTLLLAANLIPSNRIAFANELFQNPQPPDIWIAVEATSQVLDPIDLGADVWQEEGTVYFHIMTPTGWGTDAARILAKNVANVYRNLTPRNPLYRSASIGDSVAADPEGMYWMLTVSVDYVFQDIT